MKLLNTIKKQPKIWIFLLLIVFFLAVFTPRQATETSGDVADPVHTETELPELPEEQIAENAYFKSDNIVNAFFEKFNTVSDNPIGASEIQEGNIKTKALVYCDMFSMEVINSDCEFLSVSISTNPENEETTLNSLFCNCIKAMNENLSSEEISAAWDALHETGYMVEGYDLDCITIDYIPFVELSKGHSDLRIDLTFPVNF